MRTVIVICWAAVSNGTQRQPRQMQQPSACCALTSLAGAGDTVLMGSVVANTTARRMGGAGPGPSAGTGRFDATDGMPNMGSVAYKTSGTAAGSTMAGKLFWRSRG